MTAIVRFRASSTPGAAEGVGTVFAEVDDLAAAQPPTRELRPLDAPSLPRDPVQLSAAATAAWPEAVVEIDAADVNSGMSIWNSAARRFAVVEKTVRRAAGMRIDFVVQAPPATGLEVAPKMPIYCLSGRHGRGVEGSVIAAGHLIQSSAEAADLRHAGTGSVRTTACPSRCPHDPVEVRGLSP